MNQNLNSVIESIGVYLPPQLVSTDKVMQGCKKPIQFPLEKITGIRNRRMAGDTEFSVDLARKAVEHCLSQSKYTASEIDIILCCNISRYDGPGLVSFEPCTAIRLRDHFGFTNALAFDVANACAGMFTGINIVDGLIKTGAIKRGMVVSGEYITHLTGSAQRTIENFMDTRLACLTLGDAGAALILEGTTEPGYGFRDIDLQTFGGYSHYCIAKMTREDGMIMFTDSVNMAEVAIRSGARNALEVMERAQWPPDSFQHLIMHQTSTMTLNSARGEINRLLGKKVCHEGNTVNNLAERGNTASTAHFVAFYDNLRNARINKDDNVVFSITASGLTIGTALYRVDDLPSRMFHRKEMETKEPVPLMRSVGSKLRMKSIGIIEGDTTARSSSLDLLQQAASQALEKSLCDVNKIGLLIYGGVYRDEYLMEPSYASLLAGALQMNASTSSADSKTLAFDIFNGSVGFLNACYIAQQLVELKGYGTAMVVASETENNRRSFPGELMNIRETASAVILEPDPENSKGFSGFLFKYDEGSTDAYKAYTTGDTDPHLHIEKTEELEDIYIQCIISAVNALLQREGLEFSDINRFFHPRSHLHLSLSWRCHGSSIRYIY